MSFFHFPLPFSLLIILMLQMYIQNMNMYAMSLDESSTTLEVDFPIVPFKPRIRKWNYDATKRFQDSWVAKLPWAKLCMGSNGDLHIIKCRACSEVEGKDKLLVLTCEICFVTTRKLTRILKLMWRKGISNIPKFVGMPRTRNCLLPITMKILLPKLQMGWQDRKQGRLCNLL